MDRVIVALVIVLVVGVVALIARRRRVPDAPTQRRFNAPEQLDRNDFARPDAPWLVVVFSSALCDVCAQVVAKATVLECSDVAVVEVEFGADRTLHEKYTIDAVPTLVIADTNGVVVTSFLGPMTATDLWAAVAEAREPGSTPAGGNCQRDDASATPAN
jgi:thioredoxin-related protein